MPDAQPAPLPALPLLIVDDEPEIRELLRDVLEGEGYRVLTASNGAAALYVVQRTLIALVITDFMMPQLSGLDLAHRLRNDPQTAAILLILISAAPPQQMGDYFVAILHKPFAIDTLLQTVQQQLPS